MLRLDSDAKAALKREPERKPGAKKRSYDMEL